MKPITKLALIIFSLLFCILACSIFKAENAPFSGDHSKSTNTSRSTFTDKTEVEIIELEVKPDMRTNVLKINHIKLDEGQITLQLYDPDKEIQWEETLTAPDKFTEKFDLDIIPGPWQIEIEFEDASGSYNIKWEAKN
jgi:hypothetical protein